LQDLRIKIFRRLRAAYCRGSFRELVVDEGGSGAD
jgi:hypothetical protein